MILIVGIALFLSLWGLILKLQALKVCYDVDGWRLLAIIGLALLLYGSAAWLERMFLHEGGLVTHTALNAMGRTIPPLAVGRRNLSLPFDTLTYHLRSPQRGEIVGFVRPRQEALIPSLPDFRRRSMGRVVGLPGEGWR